MTEDELFVDYYNVLQIDPRSGKREIRDAYRHFAKLYHPDHPEEADLDKFNDVINAYRILRNPGKRAEYDALHSKNVQWRPRERSSEPDQEIYVRSAVSDAKAHSLILEYLYKRRRESAKDAGVIGYYVQKLLNCSDELFEFHVWYLKAKGFIEITEQGTLAITIAGVDHVISTAQAIRAEKLMIAQSSAPSNSRDGHS